jgi:hypothetical protein
MNTETQKHDQGGSLDVAAGSALMLIWRQYLGTTRVGNSEVTQQIEVTDNLLSEWIKFEEDVQPACFAGAEWLAELRERTSRHLSPNNVLGPTATHESS